MAEETKWIVNNDSGHGCEDITIWDTLEEANAAALEQWNACHPIDKQLTVITVHYVTESMLEDYPKDKPELKWYCYKEYAETPECFDSREWKKTHA